MPAKSVSGYGGMATSASRGSETRNAWSCVSVDVHDDDRVGPDRTLVLAPFRSSMPSRSTLIAPSMLFGGSARMGTSSTSLKAHAATIFGPDHDQTARDHHHRAKDDAELGPERSDARLARLLRFRRLVRGGSTGRRERGVSLPDRRTSSCGSSGWRSIRGRWPGRNCWHKHGSGPTRAGGPWAVSLPARAASPSPGHDQMIICRCWFRSRSRYRARPPSLRVCPWP